MRAATPSLPLFKYTEVAGGDHTIWPQIYADPALYTWLFSQSLDGATSLNTASPSDPSTVDPTDPSAAIPGPVMVRHASAMATSAALAVASIAVPEPTTLSLIAIGGMVLLARRRQTR